MATLQKSVASSISCVLQQGPEWSWTMPNHQLAADDADVVQGRIFWLPAKGDLPKRAVESIYGKGAAESIYGRPVVIVSRPAEDSRTAHFQIISSLQRKALGNLYNIPNEFHIGRRAGHIPITPPLDHSHASPKTTNKYFPTLRLANGARLRSDSYVNIWNVYKIDWSLLRVYTNPETPDVEQFRFGHKSTRRLLAKNAILIKYEPGTQHRTHSRQTLERTDSWSDIAKMPTMQKSISAPVWVSTENVQSARARRFSDWETRFLRSCRCSVTCDSQKSFRLSDDAQKSRHPPSKAPSDTADGAMAHNPVTWAIRRPLDCLFRCGADSCRSNMVTRTHPRREKSQLWVNAKGVMAVIIASI